MASRRQTEPAAAPEVIDIGAEQDLALVQSDSSQLQTWIAGAAEFFKRATQLEAQAGAIETSAASLTLPTGAKEDAELQRFVQRANAIAKECSGHWSIAAAFHQFHKLLVSYRERAVGKAERGAAVAQRLHNQYVTAEKRRVDEENARRQREADERARLERERELAAIEQRRIDAEAANADLSERERVFVDRFGLGGLTASQAARFAGYKDPDAQGARLAGTLKIQKAIFAAREAKAAAAEAEQVRAKPIEVAPIAELAVNVTKIGTDRATRKGELLDLEALMTAFLGCRPADYKNRFGIPADLFTVNQAKLTEYARSATASVERWPGVKVAKSVGGVEV